MKTIFWAGNYAKPEESGILHCSYDPEKGFEILAGYTGFLNPSFLIAHPRLPVLYTVEETENGAVCAWRMQENKAELLSRLPSGGADPCHLALSDDGAWLYAANYSGGSTACFSVGKDGNLIARTDLKQHTGRGCDPIRQEAAHVHYVFPDGSRVILCDLGLDHLFIYRNEEGKLSEEARVPAPAGCGPRHLAVSPAFPNLLYCVTELAATVLVFRCGPDGNWIRIAEQSALPQAEAGNTAAAIHPSADGSRLLVSHRGADAVAVMPLDAEGIPSSPVLSSCVRTPRDFMIAGEDVLVASQRDGIIRAYRLNGNRLMPLPWSMAAPCPVCLQAE